MPITTCPSCQTPLTVPDGPVASAFRCPACGDSFQYDSDPPSPPDALPVIEVDSDSSGHKKKKKGIPLEEMGEQVTALGKRVLGDLKDGWNEAVEQTKKYKQRKKESAGRSEQDHSADEESDITTSLQKLAKLYEMDLISEEEFQQKKQDLLDQL